MDTIKNPRRVRSVRVDTVESSILMSDYKQINSRRYLSDGERI